MPSAKTDCSPAARPVLPDRRYLQVCGGSPEERTQLAGRVLALLPEDFQVLVIEGRNEAPELESGNPQGSIRHLRWTREGWMLQHHGAPQFRQETLLAGDADIVLYLGEEARAGVPSLIAVEEPVGGALGYGGLDDPALREVLQGWLNGMAARAPLAGLVLGGGQSRRMGRDKALLEYHGKPQLTAACELLENFCEDVFLSLRADQDPMGRPVIQDRFLDFGPAGGILSAMHTHPERAWLVVACDLPFLDHGTLEYLLQHRAPAKGATAYRSSHDGLPEPLCAIWEPEMRPVLHRFLGEGIQCPRKALIKSGVRLLQLPQPQALDNVNHPEEYEEARRRLGKEDN